MAYTLLLSERSKGRLMDDHHDINQQHVRLENDDNNRNDFWYNAPFRLSFVTVTFLLPVRCLELSYAYYYQDLCITLYFFCIKPILFAIGAVMHSMSILMFFKWPTGDKHKWRICKYKGMHGMRFHFILITKKLHMFPTTWWQPLYYGKQT